MEIDDIPPEIKNPETRQSLMNMAKGMICFDCAAAEKERLTKEDFRNFLARSRLNFNMCAWDPVLGAKNARIMAWVEQNATKSLFIADNVGTGKTRAVCHVCVKNRKLHNWCQFWKTTDLMNEIMAKYHEGVIEMTRFKEYLLALDLLILDDFGKEKLTDRAGEVLFDILDEYYQDPKRKIWITSNVVDGKVMVQHLGTDRGTAVARRIKEKCLQWQEAEKVMESGKENK